MKPDSLPVDRRYKTSIPANAKPRAGVMCAGSTGKRLDYYLRGKLVGTRHFDEHGQLELEIPLRDGLRHGTEYTWFWGDWLSSAEPFHAGKAHGVARQWSATGKLIGTYKMVHGTGIDLWRGAVEGSEEGPYYLSEVWYLRDGNLHGFNWWIKEDQKTVSVERHYQNGQPHGIEREWNSQGRLSRGFPKYFIHGEPVDKRSYLRAADFDATLPRFQLKDNQPQRKFPPEIQQHLLKR
jgi:antitoxin component YwqK of YwqJK toxin-antitoxin module